MLLELGPVDAGAALGWTRFARRMIAEMRIDPSDLEGVATEDLLDQWSALLDQWAAAMTRSEGETFRHTQALDNEQAEFLLHGLTRFMTSPALRGRVTPAELTDHNRFTGHVAKAFISALSIEGRPCQHYQDHLQLLDV
ncbi:MAG: hypothetical protein AAFN30_02840 [Actinomycetota bacterium]